jgi:ketosteroid isomerase-like protein
MQIDITHNLPKIVADHIAACNAHDAEAWMATFAPDALLNDRLREFLGTEAIRGFADPEIFGDKVTMDVQRAWDRHGDVTVHARLDGTYDKTGLPDPLDPELLLHTPRRPDQPAHHSSQHLDGVAMAPAYFFSILDKGF